jgi:glycosyltransferase involved in cell wall biosynthesis
MAERRMLDSPLLVDNRFRGDHGIARYAREVVPVVTGALDATSFSDGDVQHLDFGRLSRVVRRSGARFLYSPGFHAAWPARIPQYLTIHDLIHLSEPSEQSRLRSAYYRSIVGPAIRSAGLCFTVSEFSKRQIVDYFRVPESSVVVTGNGCSATFLAPTEEVGGAHAEPYVLCVTNSKPYKNFSLMARAARFLPPGLLVRCVGISEADAAEYISGPDAARFRFHSGLTDAELARLYRRAVAVAVPSRMEGYGLPALEAMAQGTPVVYCAEAIDEVVLGTGWKVADPDDGEAFALATMSAMDDAPESREARRRIAAGNSWRSVGDKVVHGLRARGVPAARGTSGGGNG